MIGVVPKHVVAEVSAELLARLVEKRDLEPVQRGGAVGHEREDVLQLDLFFDGRRELVVHRAELQALLVGALLVPPL